MKSHQIKEFNVKIGSITTPRDLAHVFQYTYMKNVLGVSYESYGNRYIVRTDGDEGIDAHPDDEIVYLGFGRWRKNNE